ncbi:MAG: N-acetyltransferase [Proteobacteria bacterium]|nr:N-acetyltransferase [Pseudomonadota bacterium]
MCVLIRIAKESDAGTLVDIYAPIVRDSAISFELEPPTAPEFAQRITKTLENNPWLVLEKDGEIAGYAYASEHRMRKAYQWSVDSAIYVHPRYRQQGVGGDLYHKLFDILRLQGYYNVYAGVTLPNDSSIRLHKSLGFRPVGVYESVGYKLGAWHDVCWWQLALQYHKDNPAMPLRFPQLSIVSLEATLTQGRP